MQVFAPDKADYTWQQRFRFFLIGCLWAVRAATLPVLWTIYHNWSTYSDPQDWVLVRGLILAAVIPSMRDYWESHKNLLRIPPFFDIPPEFQPEKPKSESKP